MGVLHGAAPFGKHVPPSTRGQQTCEGMAQLLAPQATTPTPGAASASTPASRFEESGPLSTPVSAGAASNASAGPSPLFEVHPTSAEIQRTISNLLGIAKES
jgi:hypothetical protein